MRRPAPKISQSIDRAGMKNSRDKSTLGSLSSVSTASLITDTTRAIAAAAQRKMNRRKRPRCFLAKRDLEAASTGIRPAPHPDYDRKPKRIAVDRAHELG